MTKKIKKSVSIVGAGPGGLAAAMLLAHRGYQVDVFEKNSDVGGRNGSMTIDEYTFDIGPTFFMMPFVLEEIFQQTGRDLHDYVKMKEVEPLYRLVFEGKQDFYPTRDRTKMKLHIEQVFPGDGGGYEKFMQDERKKFEKVYTALKATYLHWYDAITWNNIKALPYLDLGKSVYDVMATYFSHNEMRISMTFQAKYLGMSPWKCPGFFAILPFIEHEWGIWHPIGGLNQLSKAMATAAKESGARIHTNTPVKQVVINNGAATGVQLENGTIHTSDVTVVNADFGYAATNLIPAMDQKKCCL